MEKVIILNMSIKSGLFKNAEEKYTGYFYNNGEVYKSEVVEIRNRGKKTGSLIYGKDDKFQTKYYGYLEKEGEKPVPVIALLTEQTHVVTADEVFRLKFEAKNGEILPTEGDVKNFQSLLMINLSNQKVKNLPSDFSFYKLEENHSLVGRETKLGVLAPTLTITNYEMTINKELCKEISAKSREVHSTVEGTKREMYERFKTLELDGKLYYSKDEEINFKENNAPELTPNKQ